MAEQKTESDDTRWYSHRCPEHPEAALGPLPNCFSGPLVCEVCFARICSRCSKPGASWISGTCDGCYRVIEREKRDERERAAEDRVRELQAQAWDEGATKASEYGGAYLRSILVSNPYRDPVETLRQRLSGNSTPPATTSGGDQ